MVGLDAIDQERLTGVENEKPFLVKSPLPARSLAMQDEGGESALRVRVYGLRFNVPPPSLKIDFPSPPVEAGFSWDICLHLHLKSRLFPGPAPSIDRAWEGGGDYLVPFSSSRVA